MRPYTTRLFIIITLLCFVLTGAVYASKADQLLDKARKATEAARKAEADADSTERDEQYKEAIRIYNDVYADYAKNYAPEAAIALYEVAKIQETAKGKIGNLHTAHETLRKLVNTFDKPDAVLEKNLTDVEVDKVRAIVTDSKKLKTAIASRIDKQNSQKIQYKVIDFFVKITGSVPSFSYWFAIVLVTVAVKILITPLTKAQFKSMKEMQKVAPLIKQIQEKYKGDQKTIGEKTMELYREHRINPFASCIPVLIQFPILIALYSTIKSYEFQFQKGLFLWIGSGLSHLTSVNVPFKPNELVWITARNLSEPDLILLLLYLVSMYISTKLSNVDPTQAEQQKMMSIMMPVMFAFLFAGFQSAFILYWLVFNILQTAQQYLILKSGRDEAEAEAAAASGIEPEDGSQQGGRISRSRRRRRR